MAVQPISGSSAEPDRGGESDQPYVPRPPEAHAEAPRASIDPDRSKGWIRRILPIMLAHKRVFGTALVCAFLALMFQIAAPRVVMQAIDHGLVRKVTPIWIFAVILIGLAVGRGVFGFIFRYGLFGTAYRIEYDLRSIMYEHLTRMSFSFFDRIQSGQIISRSNSDIRAVQMLLVFGPFMFINMASFLVALGLMLTIHVKLALVALLPLPLVYLTGLRMRSLMFPISWIVQARLAELATIVEENITGVRVVKSFAAEKNQIGLLAKTAQRLRWAAIKQIGVRAQFAPIMENLPRLAMALVFLYGGSLALKGQVTIGTLVAFNAYVLMLQAPFRMLGFLMMMSQRSAASAERIFEILDETPQVADRPEATHLLFPRGEVEFRDVTFAYADGPPVLKNLNLALKPGETVAVVGRTASGKSTLARLLLRFYDVQEGAVLIDGRDVRDLTQTSLRAEVGIVLDEPILFSTTIRENISYGRPEATFEEIEAAARAAGADGFIQAMRDGYETVIGERGYTLSGGQRQRVAIARTLLTNPRILILDDATSSIDVKVEQEIHEALRGLMKGRTTLIIAHRLSTISLADRVVLLDEGRVVAQGAHEELLRTEPRYVEVLARAEAEKKPAGEKPRKRPAVEAGRPVLEPLSEVIKEVSGDG